MVEITSVFGAQLMHSMCDNRTRMTIKTNPRLPMYSALNHADTKSSARISKDSLGRKNQGDDAIGRKNQGDDAIGRKNQGDDAIGRKNQGDDAIGRKNQGDDAIGRKNQGDDAIGRKNQGDDAIGRKKQGDDAIGRKNQGDDAIGRKKQGDDAIGRGTPVDIGTFETPKRPIEKPRVSTEINPRTLQAPPKKDQVAIQGDDSIGSGSAAFVEVGPSNNQALRQAMNERFETPTYAYDVTGGVKAVGALAAKAIGTAARSMGSVGGALVSLSKNLDDQGLALLGALVEKSPRALSNKDSQGKTLLENLAHFSGKDLSSATSKGATKAEILNGVLRDVLNPNQIEQGDAPTCTVTSVQFEFVANNPSEYVRVMSDLTTSGQAKMMGGGILRSDEGDSGIRDGRSASQSVFQSAAMEYGNGRFSEFDAAGQQSVNSKTGKTQAGLKPAQQVKVVEQLFGTKYTVNNLRDENEGAKVLETLRDFNANNSQNRPILMHLDQGSFNHAVTLHRIHDGQVFFRDPYGTMRSFDENLFAKMVMSVERPTV
jgi:hypothetical protein